MNIVYILNAISISILFLIYKLVDNYGSNDKPDKKDLNIKKILKETIVLFIVSVSSNFVVGEYFYNDFLSKIYEPVNKKMPTEIFTDKPGF